MLRRHHYELAFEDHLRTRRIPYVAVDEARRSLLPDGGRLDWSDGSDIPKLKSFDFVLYGSEGNLLVDVKGRRVAAPRRARRDAGLTGRLESWVTREDVEAMLRWESLFGPGFSAAFVFVYWCEDQPPDALFLDIFSRRDRWYAVVATPVRAYAAAMTLRSTKWQTVHVPRREFDRISHPLGDALGLNSAVAV